MSNRSKILCVVGTRPEAIKMAPVIGALKRESWCDVRVVATAQHREMLDQVLSLFDIKPDVDLDIMTASQTLSKLTARMVGAMDDVLQQERPDAVLAQGDTTTVMVTALVCFYLRLPFGHVEAGLRTRDFANPFPEEMNRVMASRLAKWHFAPTESAERNLLDEGVSPQAVHVTGNTVIDALLQVAEKNVPLGIELDPAKRLILVTAHRRENFGAPLRDICRAILALAERNPDVEFLYPVHPNPNVSQVVHRELGNHSRIRLCAPLEYGPFVSAMQRAYLLLTDSGGVQEEAPALGKPVLVMRAETERPEAVIEGVVKLVGPSFQPIVRVAQELLDDPAAYRAMARGISPYGDGHAAKRIVSILRDALATPTDMLVSAGKPAAR